MFVINVHCVEIPNKHQGYNSLCSTEYTLHSVCCFSWTPPSLAGIYQSKILNFSRTEVSAKINIILHTHFDSLKSKLTNNPGGLDEATTGCSQRGTG